MLQRRLIGHMLFCCIYVPLRCMRQGVTNMLAMPVMVTCKKQFSGPPCTLPCLGVCSARMLSVGFVPERVC